MVQIKREITKDIYNRALNNNGHITNEDQNQVYHIHELCGYGIYGDCVSNEDDRYYVIFQRGSSCD